MKIRKWWILAAMTSCVSMIFIDVTVLPVTLPTIQRTLEISEIGLQWIINSYTLVLAVLVLAGGRLGDMWGHRRTFCLGLFFFAIASALCGLSRGEKWFIFSRALQGVGGALLIPSTGTIIIDSFPEHQRGRAMGIYVSAGSVFLAIGPFIGGVFAEYLSWRLVFWMNLPIAFIGFFLSILFVPPSKGKPEHFDWLGFLTFALGITLIVVPLMQTEQWGWLSPLTIGLLITGLLLLLLLCFIDRKVQDPYIDFSLFRMRFFMGALLAIFFTQFLVMVTVFWSIFLQNVLEFSPVETGLLNLISNAPVILSAPFGGFLLDRYGPKVPMILGFILVIGSLSWFLFILDQKNMLLLLSAFIPFGCGVPLIFTPSLTSAMTTVAPTKRGLASGTMMTIRQLGATLGLAIFTSLFLNVSKSNFDKALAQNKETATLNRDLFSGLLSKAPHAIQAFETLSSSTQEFVKNHLLTAHIRAFAEINYLAIFMAVLGFLSVLWLVRSKKQKNDPL